jgi:hypothetical protein
MAEVFSISGAPNTLHPGMGYGFGASCPAGFTLTKNGNCQGAAAKALQTALRALGNAVRDGVLMNISADGAIGPSTAAAVNRAFTTHIGPGQAAAQFRTGTLGIFDVANAAPVLTQLINAETVRRGGSTSAAVTPRPAPTPAPATYIPPGQVTPPPAEAPPGFFASISTVGWVLIGLAGLGAAVGMYFIFRSPDPEAQAERESRKRDEGSSSTYAVRAGRNRFAVV